MKKMREAFIKKYGIAWEDAPLDMQEDFEAGYQAAIEAENAAHLELATAQAELNRELAKKLLAAQHRIEVLREALETCKREMQGDKWDSLYIDGVLATPDNTAEIYALVKDAERYRYARNYGADVIAHKGFLFGLELDAAIDAAMKEAPK